MEKGSEIMANGTPINEFDREKEFYNAKNKIKWIEEVYPQKEVRRYFINSVFGKIATYERELDREICNFSKEEITAVLCGLHSTSVDYLHNVISFLHQYTNWCLAEKLVSDNQNHFLDFTYDDYVNIVGENVIKNGILTRETLNGFVKSRYLQNLTDLAAIYLIFEGVSGSRYTDLLNLRFTDIDYKKKVCWTISGKTIPLSNDCLNVLKEASEEKEYVLPTERRMPYLDDYVVRSFRKDQADRTNRDVVLLIDILRRRVAKCLAQYEIENVTLSNIKDSGKIDFIRKNAEKKGMEVSEFIATKECRDMIIQQYGGNPTSWSAKNFYAKYKDYLEE